MAVVGFATSSDVPRQVCRHSSTVSNRFELPWRIEFVVKFGYTVTQVSRLPCSPRRRTKGNLSVQRRNRIFRETSGRVQFASALSIAGAWWKTGLFLFPNLRVSKPVMWRHLHLLEDDTTLSIWMGAKVRILFTFERWWDFFGSFDCLFGFSWGHGFGNLTSFCNIGMLASWQTLGFGWETIFISLFFLMEWALLVKCGDQMCDDNNYVATAENEGQTFQLIGVVIKGRNRCPALANFPGQKTKRCSHLPFSNVSSGNQERKCHGALFTGSAFDTDDSRLILGCCNRIFSWFPKIKFIKNRFSFRKLLFLVTAFVTRRAANIFRVHGNTSDTIVHKAMSVTTTRSVQSCVFFIYKGHSKIVSPT